LQKDRIERSSFLVAHFKERTAMAAAKKAPAKKAAAKKPAAKKPAAKPAKKK